MADETGPTTMGEANEAAAAFLEQNAERDPSPTPAAEPSASEGEQPSIPDDHIVKFKRGNEDVEMTFAELKAEGMRQADYTRKTQELAQRQQALQAAIPEIQRLYQEHQQLQAFLSNPQALQQHLAQLGGQMQQGQSQSPDDVLTLGEAQREIKSQMAALQAQMQSQLKETAETIELARLTDQRNKEIDQAISALKKQYPDLESEDDIDFMLRRDVGRLNPTTIEEVMVGLRKAAESRAKKIESKRQGWLKAQATSKSKVSRGIEPPGGTGVRAPNKPMKLGSKEMLDAVTSALLED